MSPWKHGARNKPEKGQDSWMASSIKPEAFIPGLVIGFLLGLLVELPRNFGRVTNKSPKTSEAKSQNSDEELKMVLVVRQDLKMGMGKIASQCAHAATGIYGELMRRQRPLLNKWEQAGQPKIVVTCKNQHEMNNLRAAAEKIGLPTFTVADAGRTQVSSNSSTEQNWSTHGFIDSAKQSMLASKRAEDLVYVHSNLYLLTHKTKEYTRGPNKLWDIHPENTDFEASATCLTNASLLDIDDEHSEGPSQGLDNGASGSEAATTIDEDDFEEHLDDMF